MKILVITRILPDWRSEMFEEIQKQAEFKNHEILFVYDENSSVMGYHKSIVNKKIKRRTLSIKRLLNFEYFINLRKIVRQFKPDLILIEGTPRLLNIYILAIRKKLRNDYKLCSWSSMYYTKTNFIKKRLRVLFHSFFDSFFVYHNEAKIILNNIYHYKKQIFIVGNSPGDKKIYAAQKNVEPHSIQMIVDKYKNKSKLLVLFVGKITKPKQVNLIIKAASDERCSMYKFLIIGDGPQLHELIKFNEKYNSNNNVEFLGSIREDVNQFFLAADVFLLPGTGGMALVQSIYNGNPIIATHGDGIGPEVVKNELNGFLAKKINIDFIINSLKKLEDETLRIKFSKKSVQIAKDYSTESLAKRMIYGIEKTYSI